MIALPQQSGLPLEIVLLGSYVSFGALEAALLAVLLPAWILLGRQLRAVPARHRAVSMWGYALAATGLLAALHAGEALLFYTGASFAGYATLLVLVLLHGATHRRTAVLQALLLIAGDLLLFELFVHLYAKAGASDFAALRGAYLAEYAGVSFGSVLLVSGCACKLAGLLLLVPLSGRIPPWRPGTAPALLSIGLVTGILCALRLAAPLHSAVLWYTLAAVAAATVTVYLLALAVVLGERRLTALFQGAAAAASRGPVVAAAGFEWLSDLARNLRPGLLRMERALLSWPVAVTLATCLLVVLGLLAALAGG